MADDEDDYMGDLSRFLQPHDLLSSANTSVQDAPFEASVGLNRQQKKKLKRAQERKDEDQHRSEGLGSAISSSNIGFKMLQQMGYRPGEALGKHGQGSLEPLNVDVKRSRTGLGRDHMEKAQEQVKAKVAEFKRDMVKKKQAELKTGFQERRKSYWQGRKLVTDYRKARKALHHLEEAQSSSDHRSSEKEEVSEHPEAKNLQDDNEEEDAGDPEDDSEEEIELQDLQELLKRLRTEYFYCLYCGCQYETADLLLANCPGLEEDDH